MTKYKDDNGKDIQPENLVRFKSLKELRLETNGLTRLLYHMNYWDGPLSGVMLWQGERVYFNCIKEFTIITPWTKEEIKDWEESCKENNRNPVDYGDYEDYNIIRVYAAYRLDNEVMESIDFNHNRFRNYVGTHTDYDENGNRGMGARIPVRDNHPEDLGSLKPYSMHGEFYNKPELLKKYKLELKEENIVGYFER